MRKMLLPIGLLAVACGGGSMTPPATPLSSSPEAVRAFMRAAADSNISRMAELWGTSKGPASQTRPTEYEKRLMVMQAWLHGDSTRILADTPVPGDDSRRRVSIALHRGTCVKQIPVTTVRIRDGGWIVQSVDISFAGNPARPCDPGTEPPRPLIR
jgi:hypothetical protein